MFIQTIANVSTIIGMVFSILAFLRAAGAKKAAERARNEILIFDAADDLRNLSARASDLKSFVDDGDIEKAKLRCRDLIPAVSTAKARFEDFLEQKQEQRLRVTLQQLHKVSVLLGQRKTDPNTEDGKELSLLCGGIAEALGDISGKLLSAIERKTA